MRLARRSGLAGIVAALPLLFAACSSTDSTSPDGAMPTSVPSAAALAPAEGTAASLDIGSWNIEWFGSTANGPTNETLQRDNARDVLLGMDLDIVGVAEIVDLAAWNSLESLLTGYSGFIANEPVVAGGSASYTTSEQKVGFLYKTSVATLIDAKTILTANDFDFAGRPPVEARFRVTVNGVTDTLIAIALHMKAFNDEASRQRRLNASIALKNYLDTTYPTQKVAVIGDWNDDVDVSITPGAATPFANFVADSARYVFPTRALSLAGQPSTTGFPDIIDHQLATNELMTGYVANSAKVARVDAVIPNYDATTSDHYPVLARYTLGGGTVTPPPPPPPAPTPAITVAAPNGGESYVAGSAQTIRWTAANVANVRVEYSLNNGSTWTTVTASVPAANGSVNWTVPSTTTTQGRVRVTDAAGTTNDVSDGAFAITATATPGRVIINEIMANEPGSSTAGEYVELVNVGGTAVDISRWTIRDGSAVRHTFPAGTTLAPGKAIVVFGAASGIPAGLANARAASTGDLNLTNGGDSVVLRNASNRNVDSFTYTSSLTAQDGVSMNRNPDATAGATFVLHNAIVAGRTGSPGVRVNGTAF